MPRRVRDNTSKISVAPFKRRVNGSRIDVVIGEGEIYQDSQKARATEEAALETIDLNARLTPFHLRLVILERIALNPDSHKHERVVNRPQYPLTAGMQTWLWIASQPDIKKLNLRARDVGAFLNQSDKIVSARLKLERLER